MTADDGPDAPPLLREEHDGVLLLTLNRPQVRNAVDLPLAQAMADALDHLDAEPSLSVGIVTGAGRGFCAGMDLKAFAETGQRPWAGDRGFAGIVRRASRKPLIAAIEGFAVAGGLEIALACDLIVAAKGAKIGIPEAKRSLVAAGGALRRLPRLLPPPLALELALTGELITADRAYALGAINRLVEPGEAVAAARELATAIATNGPLALVATKQIVQQQWSWSDDEFWDRQAALVDPVMGSEDAREGARAFTEKRPPRWQGR
ncbi:crotonase/enoyl-CoA hydratase family protein [Patulibacter defluvii]|uniref:crotonase/enoyl-CoA hydratase family protein n=1 Tax=Patulibacter defluvii TaxID=3095358 RepID=UPI002A75E2D1|nr:crotonase/enoyl-CoA hydratase family protein [Patulibacter sp. DM4]